MIRSRRMKWLLLIGTISFAGSALVVFFNIHYLAPITAVIVAMVVQGLRYLRTWRFYEQPTGSFLVRSAIVICVLMTPLQLKVAGRSTATGNTRSYGARTCGALGAAQDGTRQSSRIGALRLEP